MASEDQPQGTPVADIERQPVVNDAQPLIQQETAEGSSSSESPQLSQRLANYFRNHLGSAFTWRTTRSADQGEDSEGSTDTSIPVIEEAPNTTPQDASTSNSTEIQGISRARSSEKRPVCLICLEEMAEDDFKSGRAISLECACRGDLALRHKDCATKWAQVKDDGRGGVPTCELCKQPVKNLPPVPPRPRPVDHIEVTMMDEGYDHQYMNFVPTTADLVFDCVRVTWVAMIISVLFFESSLGAALWTGLVAGFAYSMMVRILYRQHFAAMRLAAEESRMARQRIDAAMMQTRGGGAVPVVVDVGTVV